MSGDSVESIATLRERVEIQSEEFGTAVRELRHVARHALEPARWIRERPLICMSGALVIGLWLGTRDATKRGRRRR